uniref:Uncharacterized protein n=1 Tax=viral metagenome TaxID=1070528 RepID=A0A6M3JGH1_9ZZZZ
MIFDQLSQICLQNINFIRKEIDLFEDIYKKSIKDTKKLAREVLYTLYAERDYERECSHLYRKIHHGTQADTQVISWC